MAGVLSRKYGINLHTFKRVYELYRPGLTGTRLLYGIEQNSHSGHSMSHVLSDGYCMKAATIAKYRPHVLKFFQPHLYLPHIQTFGPEAILDHSTEEEISVLADWVDDYLDRAVVEWEVAQKYSSFLRDLFRDEPIKQPRPRKAIRVGTRVVVMSNWSAEVRCKFARGVVRDTRRFGNYRSIRVEFDPRYNLPTLHFTREELQPEVEYLMNLAKEETAK